MILVYTTYRYGVVDNSAYHCDTAIHDGEVLTIVGPWMDKEVLPETLALEIQRMPNQALANTLRKARDLTLTVVTGDSYVTYNCGPSCTQHAEN